MLFQSAFWKVPVLAFRNTLIGNLVLENNVGIAIESSYKDFVSGIRKIKNKNSFNFNVLLNRKNNRDFKKSIKDEILSHV